MTEQKNIFTEKQQAAAAAWMARRDRGLSQAEEESYRTWLAEDPEHAQAIQYFEEVWRFCDRLTKWHPVPGKQPNPDLLAPRPTRSRLLIVMAPLAGIAAILALFLVLAGPGPGPVVVPGAGDRLPTAVQHQSIVITGASGNQRLEDGSEISVQSDTILELAFSATERRVRLIRGEASFSVAHDSARPFVVEVVGVTVQALGTVFRVALDELDVSVEVTEGSVEVRNEAEAMKDSNKAIVLAAGEKAVLRYARLIPYHEVSSSRESGAPKD